MSLANRVSEELGTYGGEVAYQVRFNSSVNPGTQIVFMTDGMLVQSLYQGPLLEKYSVIVLDDIHERTINLDILLGFIKKILYKRVGKLKVIVTSATLDI